MDMASLPTGIGSPANRRRRARVEDPVAKHGPFFFVPAGGRRGRNGDERRRHAVELRRPRRVIRPICITILYHNLLLIH